MIRADRAVIVPREIADAHARARQIVEAAASEVEATTARIRREAHARAEAELAAEHLRVAASLEREVARVVPELAIAISKKILQDELTQSPAAIQGLVERALARLPRAKRVRVAVHPDDAAALREVVVEVLEDPALERGDVVVTSELGQVDARLAVQLDALRFALTRGGR